MSLISRVKNYASLVKFAHTVFALPFALVAFLLALKEPGSGFTWILLLQLLGCMVFARNAAMGFNRWADREIDARNPRTAGRDVPSGRISPGQALAFTLVNAALFVAVAWTVNPLCGGLSFVALVFLLGYSFLKRFTWLCHFGVGAALSIAPAGAFIAVTGRLTLPVALLSLVVFFWSSGFDILYSLSDEEIDRAEGLHSIPQRFGRVRAMRISWAVHLLEFALVPLFLVTAGRINPAVNLTDGWGIAAGVFFLAMLVYQHVIISPRDLSRLNAAFFTANGIASLVFCVLVYLSVLL
ncbi:MAG: putative 4-hydroxybenzoate polyprenyltransferase [Bacteroidales bacterium]|nr:putative 4-hydroxybenzoate polyprenyltransferase [Bacteroidales bacterium]